MIELIKFFLNILVPANRATTSDHVTISLIGRNTEETVAPSKNPPVIQELPSKNTSTTVANSSPDITQDQPQGKCEEIYTKKKIILFLLENRNVKILGKT